MKLFQALRRHARMKLLTTAAVLGVTSGLLSTGLLFLINQYLFRWGESAREQVALGFLIGLPLVALARYIASVTLATLGLRAAFDFQIQLTRRILAAPLRRLEDRGPHRLLVALTDDIGSLAEALSNVPSFFINFAIVVGSLVYLGWISVPVLGVVVGFIVFGVVTYVLPLRAGIRRQRLARETEDDLFGHYRGVTQGTKELKMRRRRRTAFLDLFERTARSFRDMQLSAQRIFIGTTVWGSSLFFVLIGLLLFVVPQLVEGVPLNVQASYVMVLLYMLTPLQMLLNDFPRLTRADVAVRKIEQLGISLSEELDEQEGMSAEGLPDSWKSLELAGVAHTYHHADEDTEFTLGPLDLTLAPGELVFVVGGNGCGKTTLAKLLLGLYPPEAGELRVDGVPITAENREDYRQLFSVVFSDFFLFESLLGMDSDGLDDKARDFLTELELGNKVRVEQGHLSTVDLSQGQRKRLALMATLIEDRPIYLFDEWAADQDPHFKSVYYEQILPALKASGKLVIAISHDDRYYHLGDRVIKLDYGQLVYDKPPAETEYAA